MKWCFALKCWVGVRVQVHAWNDYLAMSMIYSAIAVGQRLKIHFSGDSVRAGIVAGGEKREYGDSSIPHLSFGF